MANSPAYLWYPKDILSSGRVSALSDLEELWYRRALDHSWLAEGLPSDPTEFAGWVGRGCTPESAAKLIERFFFEHKKDASKVVNERQEEERTKLKKKSAERAKAGIASGRKRREINKLGDEQMFNKNGTKSNIPIPIPILPSEENIKSLPSKKSKRTKKEFTTIPDDFSLTDKMRNWFAENVPNFSVEQEFKAFVNRCTAKGTEYKDWEAGWRTQMLNVAKFANGNHSTPKITSLEDYRDPMTGRKIGEFGR